MAYLYDAPNTTAGFDNAMVDLVTEVNAFIPMLLLFVFCVVFIGGSTAQRRREGQSDYPLWSVIASLSTLVLCLPLTLITGLISLDYLGYVVVITILCGFWFFTSRNKNEV